MLRYTPSHADNYSTVYLKNQYLFIKNLNSKIIYSIIITYCAVFGGDVLKEVNIFETCPTTADNLTKLSREGAVTEEKRICEISELVDSVLDVINVLISDGMTLNESLLAISDGISFGESVTHDSAITDNLHLLKIFRQQVSSLDRATFARLLSERLIRLGITVSENDFLLGDTPSELVSYVKNPYADEAYEVFSEELSNPHVKYAPSFKELLRMLSQEEVGYALLPLEERGGVRLPTVAEMILKGDFKINSVTPVFGLDGSADMKYALVSKNFRPVSIEAGDDSYLEIRFEVNSDTTLSELVSVSECLGARIYRINTVTLNGEEGESTYFTLVFCDDGGGFVALLAYLTLFAPDAVTVGMYKNLE